jgi:hypothetical protein
MSLAISLRNWQINRGYARLQEHGSFSHRNLSLLQALGYNKDQSRSCPHTALLLVAGAQRSKDIQKMRSGSDKSHRDRAGRGEKVKVEGLQKRGSGKASLQGALSVSRDVRALRGEPCRHLGRVQGQ